MIKFLKWLTHNWPIKLLSVAIAIGIWYFVATQNDPIETGSYQKHITVENESYIANGKQVFMIDDSNKVVTVYIKANRSVLRKISENDITVTADLTQIVDLNRDPVMVPLQASCTGIEPKNITMSKNAIPIVIENVATAELPVTVITGDAAVDSNYEIGKLTPDPESVTISGPESVINSIDSAAAKIDVKNLSESTTVSGKLVFIDKSQNEISEETISDDITVEDSISEISVYVELWKKKSNVGFITGYTGKPAYGYVVSSISTTPETITIAGTDEALAKIAENNNMITLPDELIDVSDLNHNTTIDINLSEVLPENTKTASPTTDTLKVRVTILPTDSAELSLDVDKIVVKNIASGLTISYVSQTLNIKVKATTSELSELTPDKVGASIDLNGYSAGEYTVPVNITLPEGYSLVEEASVKIHLKSS